MPCAGYYENDDDCCLLGREESVTARKEHKCCECGATISAGERCDFATGLYDGRWFSDYRCWSCAVLAELVSTKTSICPPWGLLSDAANDAGINWHDWQAKARSLGAQPPA
ncbi:MAG TPA: hypothetical protein VNJ70_17780 [Thermoanaerobaculia bacterium]|nr:hypothetical protein [Thermoanaerobaculia bacterium]